MMGAVRSAGMAEIIVTRSTRDCVAVRPGVESHVGMIASDRGISPSLKSNLDRQQC